MLDVRDVEQGFRAGFLMRRHPVLRAVTLSVPERSVFGFLGANGAGKTTLIHLIVGLKKPLAGTVTVRGLPAFDPAARRCIGYLPERPYFQDFLTGEDLLRYFGTLSGMPGARIRQRIPEVLAKVGMTAARKVELKRYSKGMLQRIGIAQAILHDPQFLVLDEPMSGLDPTGRREIRQLISALASEGRTIFFSTHIIPDVESLCDRAALIKDGRIVATGEIEHLLEAAEDISDRARMVDIVCTGLTEHELRGIAGLHDIQDLKDGRFAFSVAAEVAGTSVVRELVGRGARIDSLTPVRPTLEAFFGETCPGAQGWEPS